MRTFHLEKLDKLERETVIALGFFDGLHQGHRVVIDVVVDTARKKGLVPAFFTFRRHPQETFLENICFPYLVSIKEKKCIAANLGIEYYIDVDFTREFASTEPEDFIRNILIKKLRGREFVLGHDYHFGKKAKGDAKLLKKVASEYGAEVIVIPEIKFDGDRISSTGIREAILGGEMEKANYELGRWYSVEGIVKTGSKRGRKLGLPTANIDLPEDKVMPRPGVYCVVVSYSGKLYRGVGHIGHKPTFNESYVNAEVHLFNFEGDLYDQNIRVYFLKHIRDTVRFSTAEKMMMEIENDIKKCHKCIDSISEKEILMNSLLCGSQAGIEIVACGH